MLALIPLSQRSQHPSMLCTVHIVCCVCGSLGTGALLKPPCAATCHCGTSDHMTTGDSGERTSVLMVISNNMSDQCRYNVVGLIGSDDYEIDFDEIGAAHVGRRENLKKCHEFPTIT